MDYRQTIDYLYSQLPVFHRIGAAAYRPDLGNIVALCKNLDQPHEQFRSVHIGGTNGKGSVSHMLAAILQTEGYKTGLYTSPHLFDFRERIRINGEMIPESRIVDFVASQKAIFETLKPSFFEVTVAMAFDYFADQKVDIAIVEVGMGGRLDSTNILTPELSVITNIGFDHVQVLGSTLPAIAAEKAGIIKRGVPVIIGEFQEATAPVFLEQARKMEASLRFASLDWELRLPATVIRQTGNTPPMTESPAADEMRPPTPFPDSNAFLELTAVSAHDGKRLDLQLDLTGGYQKKNIKTVLSAVSELQQRGIPVAEKSLKEALRQVKALTGFAGRWQTIGADPLTICDTGHNEDGIREVLLQIAATPHTHLHMVFGMVNDKEVDKVLAMLPRTARYYFCKAAVPRAMEEKLLCEKGQALGLRGQTFPSVRDAVQAARKQANADDLVFIGGSTFVVAEAI